MSRPTATLARHNASQKLINIFSDDSESIPFATFESASSWFIISQLLAGREKDCRSSSRAFLRARVVLGEDERNQSTDGGKMTNLFDEKILPGQGSLLPGGDYVLEAPMSFLMTYRQTKMSITYRYTKNSIESLFSLIESAFQDNSSAQEEIRSSTHEIRYKGCSVSPSAIIDEVLPDGAQIQIVRLFTEKSRPASPPPVSQSSLSDSAGRVVPLKHYSYALSTSNRKSLVTSAGNIYGGYGTLPKDVWVLLIREYLSYGMIKRLLSVSSSLSRAARLHLDHRYKRVLISLSVPNVPLDPFALSRSLASHEYHAVHFWPNGLLALVEKDFSAENCFLVHVVPSTKIENSSPFIPIRVLDMKGCSDVIVSRTFTTEISSNSKADSPSMIWVDDTGSRVCFVSERGKILRTFAKMTSPTAIAIDSKADHVVLVDSSHRVQIWSRDGKLVRSFGKKGSDDGEFLSPYGVALTRENNVVVADTYNHRIQVFSFDGKLIRKIGSRGSETGQFNFPYGIDVDAADRIWVADFRNSRVQVLDSRGRFLAQIGSQMFSLPRSVKIREDGAVVVLETKRVWVIK